MAIDDIDKREELNNNGSKDGQISAYTYPLEFKIENENDTSSSNTEKDYNVYNMNFGIIEIPRIKLGFDKTMTNVKVTNVQGNVIINGNPKNQNADLKYISNLDDYEHLVTGSDYAKIEIKNEEIYGAKVEITYALTVLNNSDVNYYEDEDSDYYGYYYKFGEIDPDETKEVNITIEEVKDFLDPKLTLLAHYDEITNKEDSKYKTEQCLIIADDPSQSTETWKRLYTRIATADGQRADGKLTQDTAVVVLTRTLSNTDTDMEFVNTAEVTKIKLTDEPKLVENINKHNEASYNNYFNYTVEKNGKTSEFDNPCDGTSLTIIPPTGADMMSVVIYTIVTIVAGIVITIGIIVIKKKVI